MIEVLKKIAVRCDSSMNLLMGLGIGYLVGLECPIKESAWIVMLIVIFAALLNSYGHFIRMKGKVN